MSVTFNTFETVEVATKGAYLATATADEVTIYPQGLGRGPAITMSRKDWGRISREVRLACQRADEGRKP